MPTDPRDVVLDQWGVDLSDDFAAWLDEELRTGRIARADHKARRAEQERIFRGEPKPR